MNEILSVALRGIHHDMARLDAVAMNLANAQTAGFKREVVLAAPFAQTLAALQARSAADDAAPAAAAAATTRIDASAGTLKATGQSLDLALTGPGWFEVMTDHGLAYTRQGNFQLDAQGRLVTAQGHRVMGTSGEIQLAHGMPVIDAQGRVFEGALPGADAASLRGEPIAQLKVLHFSPDAQLQRLGAGLFLANSEAVTPDASLPATELRQGYLENANVSSMHEMVELMQTVRHVESLQKVALAYDEMLGGAIRRLGESS
ncbi:MAG TPA: flagellar hook-basal body protein [Ramlibacter sp.]|nr:flagellar hook-basal body protein [Ramlibacter sp.]